MFQTELNRDSEQMSNTKVALLYEALLDVEAFVLMKVSFEYP